MKSSKKIIKLLRGSCSQLFWWLVVLDIPENSHKDVFGGAENCIITKHKLHHVVFSNNFLKISENLWMSTSKSSKKIDGMENMKPKR